MSQATHAEPYAPASQTGRQARSPQQPPRLSIRNRYSIFVGLMKVLLPAMAAALVLLVVVWPQIMLDDDRFRLSVTELTVDQAENLTMLNARFDGIDENNQPYRVTSDMATQSTQDKDLIELELPKADITLEGGDWLAVTARSGEYRREAQLLDLIGSVNLFHDKGFELRTESAQINLEAGTAEGHDPVKGQGTAGTIDSEGFRVEDRGARIFFTGKSHLTILPEANEVLR